MIGKNKVFKGSDNQDMSYFHNFIDNKNPTIIFIHGLGSDYSSWKKQYDFFFENNYSVAGFDLRGHGKSEMAKDYEYYSLENSAKDLKKFIDFLDCENNFILVGHCLGASIIQLFENKFPNEAKALFILSGTHKKVNKLISKILKYYFKFKSFRKTIKNNQINKTHRKQNYQVKISDYDILRIIYAIRKTSLITYSGTLSHFFKFNMTNELQLHTSPMIIISGEKDSILKKEESQFIAEKTKNAKLHILKNANHVILNNNWKEINKIILKELKTL